MDIPKESDLFKPHPGHPARVVFQHPIGSRPDVYPALWDDRRVVVKGPFSTRERAEVAVTVQQLKGQIQGLPVLESEVVMALPDRGHTQVKFQLDVPRFFLVNRDVTAPHELNTRQHAIGRIVVDLARLESLGYHPNVKPWIWDNPGLAEQLVKHVLLNRVLGIGGDMAIRNILVIRGKVYNVDTDTMGNMEFILGNCQVCARKSQMGAGFYRFLLDYDLEPLRRQMARLDWSLVPERSREEARVRAQLDRGVLLALLKPKRDASPVRR
jgi:hypothetical protein